MSKGVDVKFVARQAILNTEEEIFAYELLYRNSSDNTFPAQVSDDAATGRLFFDSLLFYGLENLVHDKKAFINLSASSILGDLPKLIAPENVVLEIIERVEQLDELLPVVEGLMANNYVFALDDYDGNEKWAPLLNKVKYIKIELDPDSMVTHNRIIDLKNKYPDKKIIVERIEDYDAFDLMKKAGADYFQGYYFTKPKLLNFKNINPSNITIFELLKITLQTPLNFSLLINKVQQDAALVARILRLSNLRCKSSSKTINSISQSVIYLGEDTIKQFITVLALSELGDNKPSELLKIGLIRARFIELLVNKKDKKLHETGYLVGLVSIFDAVLDVEHSIIFKELTLSDDVEKAIEKQEGVLGQYLSLCFKIEKQNFMAIQDFQRTMMVKEAFIMSCYSDALSYADEILVS